MLFSELFTNLEFIYSSFCSKFLIDMCTHDLILNICIEDLVFNVCSQVLTFHILCERSLKGINLALHLLLLDSMHTLEVLHQVGKKCGVCGKTFSLASAFANHLKTVHVKRTCEHCGKDFSGHHAKYRLKDHVNSVHLKIRDHKCEKCGKAFASKSSLKNHNIKIHLNKIDGR